VRFKEYLRTVAASNGVAASRATPGGGTSGDGMSFVGHGTSAAPRALPVAREAVREEGRVEEWQSAVAARGSGKLSEVQLGDLLGKWRDATASGGGSSAATVRSLAAEFELDASTVALVTAHAAAPHLGFDKRAGGDYGTWAPKSKFQA